MDETTRISPCFICMEEVSAGASMLSCGHRYCASCLQRTFEVAMKNEALFRPHCCGNAISLNEHQSILGRDITMAFNQASSEFGTAHEQRVYCANPTCAKFVIQQTTGNVRRCSDCGTLTCVICKNNSHASNDCPDDPDAKKMSEYAATQGWKKCPGCKRICEHIGGCEHMVCRCGTTFCYNCLASPYGTCKCPHYNQARAGFDLGEVFANLQFDEPEIDQMDIANFAIPQQNNNFQPQVPMIHPQNLIVPPQNPTHLPRQ